jgi:hypothetical protein
MATDSSVQVQTLIATDCHRLPPMATDSSLQVQTLIATDCH